MAAGAAGRHKGPHWQITVVPQAEQRSLFSRQRKESEYITPWHWEQFSHRWMKIFFPYTVFSLRNPTGDIYQMSVVKPTISLFKYQEKNLVRCPQCTAPQWQSKNWDSQSQTENLDLQLQLLAPHLKHSNSTNGLETFNSYSYYAKIFSSLVTLILHLSFLSLSVFRASLVLFLPGFSLNTTFMRSHLIRQTLNTFQVCQAS